MYRIILIPTFLLLGYLTQVLFRIASRKKPGESSLSELIPYLKEFDIETIIDLVALIVIGGLWLNPPDIIPIEIPKTLWAAPLIGFLAPWIWNWLINWVKNKFSGNGKN